MPKFHLEKLIRAKREHVFDIVANYENYQKLLPQYFKSVQVRSVRQNVAVVEQHLQLGDRKLIMMTKHIMTYPHVHEVIVLGGHAKGSRILEKYDQIELGTKLAIDVDLKLSRLDTVFSIFSKKNIAQEFDKIMDEFSKIAEKP